ncbi:MAG: tetratricopeptide repeat protein [Pseudomonadota bacterium]
MRCFKSMSLLVVLASVLSAQALSIADVEAVSIRNDLSGLTELRDEAEKQDDGYLQAFLEYRIAVAANAANDAKLAKRSLKTSAKLLRGGLETSPNSVQHMTLLANVYGLQIGINPMKGMTLGRKSHALIDRAMNIDPTNPHTLLAKGISDFNTPSMFGGSKGDALKTLDAAIKAFGASPDAQWGAAEAHVWRALALDEQARRSEAVAALNTALEIEPDYAWARFILRSMAATS